MNIIFWIGCSPSAHGEDFHLHLELIASFTLCIILCVLYTPRHSHIPIVFAARICSAHTNYYLLLANWHARCISPFKSEKSDFLWPCRWSRPRAALHSGQGPASASAAARGAAHPYTKNGPASSRICMNTHLSRLW